MNKQEFIQYVSEHRNELKRCPICNSSIEDRTIALFKELMTELYKVYQYCKVANNYYFKMKDVRHLLSKNSYARFGDIVRFSGIVFKANRSTYGINKERLEKFFRGESEIPVEISINQITNEIINKKCVTIDKFPELKQLLSNDGMYNYKAKLFS